MFAASFALRTAFLSAQRHRPLLLSWFSVIPLFLWDGEKNVQLCASFCLSAFEKPPFSNFLSLVWFFPLQHLPQGSYSSSIPLSSPPRQALSSTELACSVPDSPKLMEAANHALTGTHSTALYLIRKLKGRQDYQWQEHYVYLNIFHLRYIHDINRLDIQFFLFITKTTKQHKTTEKEGRVKEWTRPRQNVGVLGVSLLSTPQASTHTRARTHTQIENMHTNTCISAVTQNASCIRTQKIKVSLGPLRNINVSFPCSENSKKHRMLSLHTAVLPLLTKQRNHGITHRWQASGATRGPLVCSWSCMYRCWYFQEQTYSYETRHRSARSRTSARLAVF